MDAGAHLPCPLPYASGLQVMLNGSGKTPPPTMCSLSRKPSFPHHSCCKSGKRCWRPCKLSCLAPKSSMQTVVIGSPGSFLEKQNLRPCIDVPGEATTYTVKSFVHSGTFYSLMTILISMFHLLLWSCGFHSSL